jgi:FMN phosphatase YigB (HAD superfamily)
MLAFKPLENQLISPEKLTEFRQKAERMAVDVYGVDLYSIDQIYDQIQNISELDPLFLFKAKQQELKMERDECFPISEGRRLLEKATKGSQVIYVSDMYLPPAFIRELLEKNGLWIPGSRLFVSHVEGCAKHSGLFSKICKELGAAPDEIAHYGDNWESDVVAPRKIGIRAVHFTEATQTRYEKRFSGTGEQEISDVVRTVRLQSPWTNSDHKKVIYETAASIAAPLFIAYVIWLEKRAQAKGINRLYFISRDGLIFKKIYDLLFKEKESAPTSHYLYGSRHAWSCVRWLRLERKDIQALTCANPTLSLQQFCDRCGVPIQEMYLEPLRGLFAKPDQPLNRKEIAAIENCLREGPWRDKIMAEGRGRGAIVKQYFLQSGMSQSVYGLVDLGWFGNLQLYVETLLPDFPPRCGYYLNLRSNPRIVQEGRAEAFISSLPFKGIDLITAVSLLEVLATAPAGSLREYRKEGSEIIPITEGRVDYFDSTNKVEVQHEAILAVAAKYKSMLLDSARDADTLRIQALQNFRSFLEKPTPAEAEVYGSVCFVSRQEGGKGVELGPRLGLIGALKALKSGFYTREACWPQGMIQRSRGLSRILLKGRLALTILRGYLQNMLVANDWK